MITTTSKSINSNFEKKWREEYRFWAELENQDEDKYKALLKKLYTHVSENYEKQLAMKNFQLQNLSAQITKFGL